MTTNATDPSPADVTARAVADLARWAAALRWDDVPEPVRERLALVLFDTLAVTALGAELPEHAALVAAWRPGPGPAPLAGTTTTTTTDTAAHLNAVALVSLELDEGNKFARGHPAAHGFPAVLALACELDASGQDTATALLVAYEVAARFGRATSLRAGAHPHGNWGVAGAAAGCARLLGLDADATAAAIDAGSALPVAGHFASALDGNPVRNTWVGVSNTSGLAAARLAAAGLARNTGSAATSLGDLLGRFDPTALTAELGRRHDITRGYFKRHASCSFTHPAADAVLALRRHVGPANVDDVLVETHSLGAGLDRTSWDSRLGAMFSTPFVVAAALQHGRVGPRQSGPQRDDPELAQLAARVRVRTAADLDARLPVERAARVTIHTDDGRTLVHEVPNPVGDADHHPLDADDVAALFAQLLADPATLPRLREQAYGLATAPSVRPLLAPSA
ncbi:2-methylcitrate dehydratase PrpD [Jatrophihabitans endophyticus]|uniref:2-methylcitrate dehydratase PrpD n=1 Tax=Jatrophihabitans endophyticus TaxID=1206085 RepID=A0A1M5M034_9ACTN|nr:MmgE/PrpD family protein [Jatrophihabitans endophyticus]SHG70540.1 2-methylcitrate dehydratase PrpD [Jatrophihabitans endophyticus]